MMRRTVTTALVLMVVMTSVAGCGTGRLALSQIPQGVSRQTLAGTPVIAFRHGRDVRVFIADVHHIPGEGKALVWCPAEKLVVAKTHGEAFDEEGAVVAGPASRGLDEVPVEFKHGYIERAGADKVGRQAATDRKSFDFAGLWDAGPGTFCDGMQEL